MNTPGEAGRRRRYARAVRELAATEIAIREAEANLLASCAARGMSDEHLVWLRQMFIRVAAKRQEPQAVAIPGIPE